MLANLTKKYPIESTPSNQSEPAHSPPRAIRLAGPPVVEFYDALRSAGHVQPPLGRVIKLSVAAETPGVDSAAATLRAWALTYSAASVSSAVNARSHQERCRSVSSFGTMHQIAFTDDANQLALVVHNGCGADPSFQKNLGDLLSEEEGFTVITGKTITSRAFIANLLFATENYRSCNCL